MFADSERFFAVTENPAPMAEYTAAVIGTGPDPDDYQAGSHAAMGYRHGETY